MDNRRIRANLAGMILGLLLTSWSVAACAQKAGGASSRLESAGDGAKFRVIERFPDKEEPSDSQSVLGDVAQVPEPIQAAIDQQRWKVARLLVEKQPVSDDAYLKLLDGYLNWRAGDAEKALGVFEALNGKVADLEDYRLFWAAKSALDADKAHQAAMHAAKVPRDSRLFGKSLILLADSLVEAGTDSDLSHAVETLELYLAKYPNGRNAEAARLLVAQTYEKQKHWDKAAKAYLEVLAKDALTDSAATAKARLGAIREHLSKDTRQAVDHPPLAARMQRYRALFAHHRSKMVIAELQEELPGLKDDKKRRCEALYLVAKSHSKLRRHTDGAKWYKRILDECAGTPYALKALYLGGKGYWNAGKRDEARKWFGRIWSKFAKHSFADDAMYFAARILREEKKPDAAKKLLKKQVARYPTGDMAKNAHWLLVREMFADSNYKGVVAYVDGLESTGEDDVYSRGRLHYFRGRALEKLGKADEAQKAYREVAKANPLSYYAFLAMNRLGQMVESAQKGGRAAAADLCALDGGSLCDFVGATRSPKVAMAKELRDAPHFVKGRQLLRLGLTDLAEGEFQALRRSHGSDDNLWALAYLLDAAHAYRVSHDLARRHIQGWKTHYPADHTDPHWSLAYPTPFRQLVDQYVTKRKIPRALVYAIMREESGFNPRIESWANARGLLQLMEATAAKIAKKDGLAKFTADDLFDPATNIRLGTGYIDELSDQLAAHPALIIAGYNAGYGNVSRWLEKRGDLPLDLWVEDIPYGQTRKYTKRVLASFWTYSWMYGPSRVPRVGFKLPESD